MTAQNRSQSLLYSPCSANICDSTTKSQPCMPFRIGYVDMAHSIADSNVVQHQSMCKRMLLLLFLPRCDCAGGMRSAAASIIALR